MSALGNRPFVKMNGLGNEILVVDLRDGTRAPSAREVEIIARLGGVAFDQLMTIKPGRDGSDARMRIFNRDGSEVSACGNGTRCVAWLLMRESGLHRVRLDSPAGPLIAEAGAAPRTVMVDMGVPRFAWHEIPLAHPVDDTQAAGLTVAEDSALRDPALVNMGNPHAVFFVENPKAHDLARIGPVLEHHPLFPERANISLAQVTAADAIALRVWERGAGLTQACGTAACAAAVAGARTGRTGRSVTVTLPGGPLQILWRESDDHVLMTGPVELEFEGRFDAAIFGEVSE